MESLKIQNVMGFMGLWDDYGGKRSGAFFVVLVALICFFSIVIYRSYDLKRREMNLRISLAENRTSAQYIVPAEEVHTEEGSGSQGMLDELLLPILNFIEALISRILSGLLGLLL
jgi:hypothetical protein